MCQENDCTDGQPIEDSSSDDTVTYNQDDFNKNEQILEDGCSTSEYFDNCSEMSDDDRTIDAMNACSVVLSKLTNDDYKLLLLQPKFNIGPKLSFQQSCGT